MKIALEKPEKLYHFYPTTVTLVAAKYGDKENAMAAAWHTALSTDPPLYGVAISPKRLTYQLIREAREFSVNFLPFEYLDKLHGMGKVSGRDVDKFSKFPLGRDEGARIDSPIIREAYASYECLLEDEMDCGDHTLFVGRIVIIHYEEDFFQEGRLRTDLVKPILYLGSDNYITTREESYIKLA